MNNYKLSVAFCATNESESLAEVYSEISSYNCASEYIFVLSQTASSDCIRTVQNICRNSDCRYMFQKEPGLGSAIREAINESKGSHIIVWPADNGMDTNAFPTMVELSRNNPDKIVSASRWLKNGGFENYGQLRKVINYISQKMFAVLYKSDLTDFTNPTQIAPLKIYNSINWQGHGWDFIPEMIFKPLKCGYSFIEWPCKNTKRKEGRSNSNIFKIAQYYLIILKIYFMSADEIKKQE